MTPAVKPPGPFEIEAVDASLEMAARASSIAVKALAMGMDRAALVQVAGAAYDDALAAREKMLAMFRAEAEAVPK